MNHWIAALECELYVQQNWSSPYFERQSIRLINNVYEQLFKQFDVVYYVKFKPSVLPAYRK